MKDPGRPRSRLLCRTPYVEVHSVRTTVQGRRRTYYVSRYGERVGALLIRKHHVLLVRQFRYLAGGPTWEIPGGRIEKGESAAAAAARECFEETGWRAAGLHPLVTYLPGTDIIDNRTTVLVGTPAGREDPPPGRETSRCRWVPLPTCLSWVRQGKICCGMTALAVCSYQSLKGRSARER